MEVCSGAAVPALPPMDVHFRGWERERERERERENLAESDDDR